mmetsp:Transcript_56474/g.151051  ORF Transcript_56474/g.151051 Transcript_56474/m.151051 type:complete len:95 (-) Transcript_56474:73-357(-)
MLRCCYSWSALFHVSALLVRVPFARRLCLKSHPRKTCATMRAVVFYLDTIQLRSAMSPFGLVRLRVAPLSYVLCRLHHVLVLGLANLLSEASEC